MPPWSALIVHVPAATSVIELPSGPPEVQTAVVVLVNVTGNPLEDVAATTTGVSANVFFGGAANVIVLASFETASSRLTGLAGQAVQLPVPRGRAVTDVAVQPHHRRA